MHMTEVCPQCCQPMKEVFCWCIQVNGVVYYPSNTEYLRVWICERRVTDPGT